MKGNAEALTIQLQVIPSNELKATIRSYGYKVEVMESSNLLFVKFA